jgi:hypothetical protein
LEGERQRGTVIYKRRNSISVVKHGSPGTVIEYYNKSLFIIDEIYCSPGTIAINLHHPFLFKWLREKERQRHFPSDFTPTKAEDKSPSLTWYP